MIATSLDARMDRRVFAWQVVPIAVVEPLHRERRKDCSEGNDDHHPCVGLIIEDLTDPAQFRKDESDFSAWNHGETDGHTRMPGFPQNEGAGDLPDDRNDE